MLLRLAYIAVTNTFAALRLLPIGDRDKDIEILALRHQITVLERQLGPNKATFAPEDRTFLAALLAPLPRGVLRRLRLLVQPDTVLRWHRDLMKRRHARTCRPRRPGRPPTVRSIRVLTLRLVKENPSWGYRRIHGELATLGITIAPSTVWEILKQEGLDPAPDRHATILGTTTRPTAAWVTQTIKNLVMDLQDAGTTVKFLIRDRDAKFSALIDKILTDTGIQTLLTGIRVPRMNSIMERWVQSCRHELLDRTLIWNEHHLRHALREYETFYNSHRAHQAKRQAAPLRPVPAPITDPDRIAHLDIHRHDRLGGVLHEYLHAA